MSDHRPTNPPGRRHRWPLGRLAVVGLATMVASVVSTATVVSAFSDGPGANQRPARAISRVVPSAIPRVDRPPVDTHPLTPGITVSSGQDQSDPVLDRFGGRYFLYTSGIPGPDPVDVPVASTDDFATWGPVTDALPALPAWAVPGFTWAPEVHRFGSGYVLYFTAMVRGTSPAMECIGAATGAAPDGPFVASPTPFICQAALGGSIDPRVFTDATGSTWMLWKSDQNIAGSNTPTQMWSEPLAPDGLHLTGRPTVLMGPDRPWQGTVVEAPDLIEVAGAYWLFYSGNWFNGPEYAIGAARCAGPAGPCSDPSPVPLLASNLQGAGPGEASVFADTDGVWMLYSPWRSSAPHPDIPPRPVDITRLGFDASGPYLAAGGPPPGLEVLRTGLLWSGP
jgi:hypothetical protein